MKHSTFSNCFGPFSGANLNCFKGLKLNGRTSIKKNLKNVSWIYNQKQKIILHIFVYFSYKRAIQEITAENRTYSNHFSASGTR